MLVLVNVVWVASLRVTLTAWPTMNLPAWGYGRRYQYLSFLLFAVDRV